MKPARPQTVRPKAPDFKAAVKTPVPNQPSHNRQKSFGTSSASKFVLFVGDEGAILVYVKRGVVESRQYVPDGSPENIRELRNTLEQNTRASILLIVDNMDQKYVQQTLPPVSRLAINNLVRHRLERDFRRAEIKGAIMLGREKSGKKSWSCLMVALDKNPQLSAWVNFVMELPHRFQGIYLVPTEAKIIVNKLEAALGTPKKTKGSEWKFFISHNKVGGVRQVVIRNGQLASTRMTQLIGESTPGVIAGNIEQEISNTLEYMRRLGLNAQSRLDIYIIASTALKSLIDRSKFNADSFHILTPYEVAQYLGIKGATQPADQFGDVMLAAAIACSKEHALTLALPLGKKFDRLHQVMRWQRMAAAAVAVGIAGYACTNLPSIYSTYAKKAELEQAGASGEKALQTIRAEAKQYNLDVEQMGDLVALYQKLQGDKITPLPFIEQVGGVIKQPATIKTINWSVDSTTNATPKMTAVFTLEFPDVKNRDEFKPISKKMLAELKAAFKGADVAFTRLPPKFADTEKKGKKSPSETANASDVELTIKGNIPAPPSSQPQAAPLLAAPTAQDHP
jgi:hypothetical protein